MDIHHIAVPYTSSTNGLAKELIQKGKLLDTTLVTTDYQTAGKGQQTAVWESEAGANMLASIVLYPRNVELSSYFLFTQLVSVAIVEVLETNTNLAFRIKWPNDIYIQNKKIAGILIETQSKGNCIENIIIGIGLNINQQIFSNPTATSLALLTGTTYQVADMTNLVYTKIIQYYKQKLTSLESLLKLRYLHYLLGYEQENSFLLPDNTSMKGTIKGVDTYGRLQVQTTNNELKIYQNKEIKMVFI